MVATERRKWCGSPHLLFLLLRLRIRLCGIPEQDRQCDTTTATRVENTDRFVGLNVPQITRTHSYPAHRFHLIICTSSRKSTTSTSSRTPGPIHRSIAHTLL